ncbi:hypothetical protein J1N35_003094 [Gossypium stocksii]|uniref:Disease resistance N-terminal domain-containing protein n=1 Tax=Gossypium stocksii TaxID=47602 RepID=A0A9D4ANA4_9ROSI|nr:hypothetical protein J1N35_003094 [Gossypium stocksii]
MAEVAVSLVMEKLTSLLSKDVELLRGIHEEVEDIKVELEFITCFLKEADARAVRDQDGNSINGVKTWVKLAVARRDPRVGLQFVQDNGLVGIDSLRNELVDRLISGPSVRTIVSLVGGTTVEDPVEPIFTRQGKSHLPMRSVGWMKRSSLPNPENIYWTRGSRVIITARNAKVAEFCKRSSFIHIHNLKPMPLKLARELLYKTAFRFDPENQCPLELKELSLDIARRCEGLPLAIVAIGGLLSTKGKDVLQWESLHNSFSAEFDSNPHLTDIKKDTFIQLSRFALSSQIMLLVFGNTPRRFCATKATCNIGRSSQRILHGAHLLKLGSSQIDRLHGTS